MRAAKAGAVAAMRRKSSGKRGKDEPTTPRSPVPSGRVELDSAAAVSDELQAVLLAAEGAHNSTRSELGSVDDMAREQRTLVASQQATIDELHANLEQQKGSGQEAMVRAQSANLALRFLHESQAPPTPRVCVP